MSIIVSRRNFLAGAAALIATGCAAAPKSSPQGQAKIFYDRRATVRIIESPLFQGPEYTVFHHVNLQEAARPVVARGARVIAFGELHAATSAEPSTLQAFAREIMPLLHDGFYDDGVFEPLPSGSRAEAEIEQYKKTGFLGPVHAEWLARHPDAAGITMMLEAVRRYQSGLSGSNCLDLQDYRKVSKDEEEIQRLITRNTVSQIRKLLAEGKKVFAFNGTYHNDFTIKEGNEEANFGKSMREEMGDQFIQADLYQKDILRIFSGEEQRAEMYIDVADWREWVSQSGANRLHYHSGPNAGREVIIF